MSGQSITTPPSWSEKIDVYEFQGVEKFYDIMPVLADSAALKDVISGLVRLVNETEFFTKAKVGKIACIDARGFLLGAPVAYSKGIGLIPIRKPNKLPGETIAMHCTTEYSKEALTIQVGAVSPGEEVVIIDDLIATGGSVEAAAKLIEGQGGKVMKVITLIELTEFDARERLAKHGWQLESLVQY